MERTDWLDEGLDSADARFLMLTAITHHQFSSPAWGSTRSASSMPNSPSLTVLAAQAVVDHDVARSQARRTIRPFL